MQFDVMASSLPLADMQTLAKLGIGTQIKPHIERRFFMPYDPPRPRLREYVLTLKAIFIAPSMRIMTCTVMSQMNSNPEVLER